MRFTTRLLHEAFAPDAATGATTQPLYQTSAFYQPTAEEMARVFAGRKPGFVYTRVNNPTVARFEQRVNALEGGVGAVACASGMAAVSHAVLNILSQGDEILASGGLYGGTSSLFHYPGLPEHPSHALAARQFGGRYGAMLTLRLGTRERAFRFIDALHYALNVSNIGDARTLVIHPASTIFLHASEEEKANAGVTDDLVRINVGLEDIEDLQEDFAQALDAR